METQVLNIVTNAKTNLEQKTESGEDICSELFSEILQSESENKDKDEFCAEANSLINMLSAVYQIKNDASVPPACVVDSEETTEIKSIIPNEPDLDYAAKVASEGNNSENIIDEFTNALFPIKNSQVQETAETLEYANSDNLSDFDISLTEVTEKPQAVNSEPVVNNSEIIIKDKILYNPNNSEPVLELENKQKNKAVNDFKNKIIQNPVNENAFHIEIKKNLDKAGTRDGNSEIAPELTIDNTVKSFKAESLNKDIPTEVIEDYNEFSKVLDESSDVDFSSDNDKNSTPFQLDARKTEEVNDSVVENMTQVVDSIDSKGEQIQEINTTNNIKQLVSEVNDKIIKSMTFTENDLSQEFELQIRPESLGKLVIKLQKSQDIMKVKIITTSPEVKEMLSANTQLMQLQINDKGVELSNVEIVYQNLSGDKNMQGRERTEQQNKRKNYKVKDDYNQYISSADGNSVSNYININGSVSYLV